MRMDIEVSEIHDKDGKGNIFKFIYLNHQLDSVIAICKRCNVSMVTTDVAYAPNMLDDHKCREIDFPSNTDLVRFAFFINRFF